LHFQTKDSATQVGGAGGGSGGINVGNKLAGGSGYAGKVVITYTQGTDCTSYGCLFVRDHDNSNRAIFSGNGFIDLDGTLTQNDATGSGTNDFIIQNSTGVVAWIDDATGNMKIAGILTQWQNTTCNATAGSFIIRNSVDSCVAYINKTGGLWVMYGLTENAW